MGTGERYPAPISSRETEIQIVGPDCSGCTPIINGTVDYLKRQRFDDVESVFLGDPSRPKNKIMNTKGAVFIFLHPTHSKVSSAKDLNQPLIQGVLYWGMSYPERAENTYIIFEGLDNDVVRPLVVDRLQERFSEMVERYIDKGQIQEMRESIFTQCVNFGL